LDVPDYGLKLLLFLLISQDFEALDQRHTGINHHRELPRKDRKVLRIGIAAKIEIESPGLFFRGLGEHDLLSAEGKRQSAPIVGSAFT
jgi:hypothetical protein